jgi:hypothetical protein
MYKYKKYFYFGIYFCFFHTYVVNKYPNIIRYENNKKEILHSDCIFGPKNIAIKYVDIFIKSIKK